jgi:NADPH:quinone reductase-like Zn-dependent oxidoreductase
VKAIQMTEQGTPDVLRLVDLPDPFPGPGQVLVSVDAAAVNFSDVMRRRGDVYPVPTPRPFVPGAEVAGTVARLIVYGSVSGTVNGLDTETLEPLLYDPAPSQILTGFNLGTWFEHRLPDVAAALEQLVGWIARGQLSTSVVQAMPLSAAAEAHRSLESGRTIGKLVLTP